MESLFAQHYDCGKSEVLRRYCIVGSTIKTAGIASTAKIKVAMNHSTGTVAMAATSTATKGPARAAMPLQSLR